MAQITALQPYGVPGRTRTFTAKTAAALTAISIIAASMPVLVHVSDTRPNLVVAGDVEVQGDSYFGNSSGHVKISDAGDLLFVSGGGLAIAEINVVSNAVQTVIASSGVAVQVTIFNTNGPSNNITPDHTNDHITITEAGIYLITVSSTINSVSGAASRLEMTVLKNNGAALVGALHCDRDVGGGGSESGSVSISGLADLSVDDTIEVWIENETNTQNYIVEDITLTLVQIGGT